MGKKKVEYVYSQAFFMVSGARRLLHITEFTGILKLSLLTGGTQAPMEKKDLMRRPFRTTRN